MTAARFDLKRELFGLPAGFGDVVGVIRRREYAALTAGLHPLLRLMAATPQEAEYHGEGDVLAHTKLVLAALETVPGFAELPATHRDWLRLAAFLHDAAKPFTLIEQEGRLTNPHHSERGVTVARTVLAGLCPLPERELVASLVRWHSAPVHVHEVSDPEARCARLSFQTDTALLACLATADQLGRAAPAGENLDWIREFATICRSLDCLGRPYPFGFGTRPARWLDSDPYDDWYAESRYMLFDSSRKLADIRYAAESVYRPKLYFDVYLLCGMPGAGKDWWRDRCGIPGETHSLDRLLAREGYDFHRPDAAVKGRAIQELARGLRQSLAARQSCFLNMTNISRRLRKKYLRIAYDYGARVTIIHLDVPFATVLARNGTRDRMIPRDYLEDLWFELEFPLPYEAHRAWYVSGT